MGGDMEISGIDLIFAAGTSLFMASAFPALVKLHRVKYSDAQSLVHNEIHLIALSCMFIGYALIGTPLSITITVFELVMRIYLIRLIRKKRSHELTYPSDILYYTIKGGRRIYDKIVSRSSVE